MSKLVPSVELKKADGKPIKFNFQFENGLPMKPLYDVSYEIWRGENISKYGITIVVKKEFNLTNVKVTAFSYHNTKSENFKDIWIHLDDCYLTIKNVEKPLVDEIKSKGLVIEIVDENGQQLNGKL